MSALLIGIALVVGSAALFGYALFGQRPVPQPATIGSSDSSAPVSEDSGGRVAAGRPERIHLRAADVRPSTARRLRASGILAVGVVGAALLVGTVVSILFVGAVLMVS